MYGRHYESTYHGSMRKAGPLMFAVWGYVVSHQKPAKDGQYYVELNEEELADCIGGTTIKEVSGIIEKLQQPDPRSRTPDKEGRRLIKMAQFSYLVVNGAHYQRMIDDEARRAYWREKKKVERAKPSEEPAMPVELPSHFPKTEAEAKAHAEFVGATPEFAVHTWNKAMSRNGRDAKGQPIRSFRHYLATEKVYAKEREQSEVKVNGKPTSVFNLREIIKVKEERAVNIRATFCSDTASGPHWSDAGQQKEYVKLRKDIKELKLKLESLA